MRRSGSPRRTDAAAPTSVGNRLRRAREATGLSLADLAAATRISERALDAIERERFDALPGGVFRRSYVQDYARAVGLEGTACVQAYLRSCDAAHAVLPSDEEFEWPRPPLAIAMAAVLAAVLGLAVIALG